MGDRLGTPGAVGKFLFYLFLSLPLPFYSFIQEFDFLCIYVLFSWIIDFFLCFQSYIGIYAVVGNDLISYVFMYFLSWIIDFFLSFQSYIDIYAVVANGHVVKMYT